MTQSPTSLVDILQWRAKNQPQELAYRFLTDGEYDEVVLNYEQLDRHARAIAALLQASIEEGDRVILLFPPGLEFITSFFGCLYAKAIAVPVYPPHPARIEINLPIIRRLAVDADAAAILLNSLLYAAINNRDAIRAQFGNMKLLVKDSNDMNHRSEQWQQTNINSKDIAFLQYTSGSTATPKGVIISHKNLLSNLGLIEKSFGVTKEDHGIFWLPPYHDMGLIGGVLQPIYSGATFTLMPHLLFLQRPIRWLQAVSRFKATISGAPNFAYDLCTKKIRAEQRAQLDLSSWRVAFNGAEPIYHKTLNQFTDYFAPCGFRREAFATCYGLAESTLFAVGGTKGGPPLVKNFSINGIEQNKVIESIERTEETRTLVSCGQISTEQKIRIVNPETNEPCLSNEIGEIWVSGPSIANGYWNKLPETEFTFGAKLSHDHEGIFLRTGDIGFIHNNELYVTGRLKNLIISDGKNHYPNDIERTVEASHPAIRPSGSAVFSILNHEKEDVIIVAETNQKLLIGEEEIVKAIREAVSVSHGLHIADIKLTVPGAIPRTTSGKTKHFLCKQYYLAGTLKEIETV